MPVDGKMCCVKCSQWQDVSAFSPNNKRPSGLSSYCKPCQARMARAYYEKNREKCLNRVSSWHKENKDKREDYRKKHPEQARVSALRRYRTYRIKCLANKAVNNAIRAGKLKRGACEVCGKPNAHGHHWSYLEKNWLNVTWLCRKHHHDEHKRLRREGINIEAYNLVKNSKGARCE